MRLSAPLRVPPLIENEGCSSGPPGRSAIASVEPRSWPDEKIGPTPPRITTRTVSSASARRNTSSSSTSRPRFCAFRLFSRLSMIRTIAPSSRVSYVTYLYSAIFVDPLVGDERRLARQAGEHCHTWGLWFHTWVTRPCPSNGRPPRSPHGTACCCRSSARGAGPARARRCRCVGSRWCRRRST